MRMLRLYVLACWLWLVTLAGYLTTRGLNEVLNAAARGTQPVAWMKYVGLFKTLEEKALTTATTSGSKLKLTSSEAKGFVSEKIVVFTEINGTALSGHKGEKIAGLYLGLPYFIVGAAANEFEVALLLGGTAVTPSAEVKVTTKLALLEELPETPYARVLTAFPESKTTPGETTDTEKKIKVPASTTVTFAGWWEKSTKKAEGESGGKANELAAAVEILENSETFSGAGEYALTSDKLEGVPL